MDLVVSQVALGVRTQRGRTGKMARASRWGFMGKEGSLTKDEIVECRGEMRAHVRRKAAYNVHRIMMPPNSCLL